VAKAPCPVCGRTFFTRTGTHRFCTPVCRARAKTRAPGVAARYGCDHQELRQRVAPAVASGLATCTRCSLPIEPGQRWDLDHRENGGYRGPSHSSCNRAAGADAVNGWQEPRRVPAGQPEGLPDEPIEDPAGFWWGRRTRRECGRGGAGSGERGASSVRRSRVAVRNSGRLS
jgi:hypothetical protein